MNVPEILTEQFPLNHVRYNHVMDELRVAERGFEELHWRGWLNDPELDDRLMKIRKELGKIWEPIQKSKRQSTTNAESKREL